MSSRRQSRAAGQTPTDRSSNFSPASLAAGLVLVAFGVWFLVGGVTFDALFPALLGGLGLILLVSGLARRR